MKRILSLAMALGFGFVTASAAAQEKQPPPKPPPGGTMEMESTTKHKGEGPSTKTTTKTVIGTVKEYEAGKKIVVTGPKKKDYSFNLDQNAGVTGDIEVGKKVKVSYTKSDGGDKVTTVAPYPAPKKSSRKPA